MRLPSGITPSATQTHNIALGGKSILANGSLKNAPILNGTPRKKKKQRKYYRTRGKFLPNRKLSRQRAYAKLAANQEWRERHNAKQRVRYYNDPVFRAEVLQEDGCGTLE